MAPNSPGGPFGKPGSRATATARDLPNALGSPFGWFGVVSPTAGQAARFDEAAIRLRRVSGAALMENAGRQAALVVHQLYPRGKVVALVGSGNNGGDALVCLRALAAWGRDVTALVVGRRPRSDSVAHGWDLQRKTVDPGAADEVARLLSEASVVVDGLLGTGIKGAPREACARVVGAANEARAPVVALDAPSGVDGTTGRIPGASIEAEVTIAFGWPKLGTLLHPGRTRCGRIVAVEIGLPPAPGGAGLGLGLSTEREGFANSAPASDCNSPWAELVTPGWVSEKLPRRPPSTHKNAVGALAVVAGSAMPGAAVLAARSAFRCGTGLVRACAAPPGIAELVAALPEALFVETASETEVAAAVEASSALAVGPGLGTGAAAARPLEWAMRVRKDVPAVLDADALTLLAGGVAGGVQGLATGGEVVLTPHPGEMARLTGTNVAAVQRDRPAAARSLAATAGAVVLLKGAPSLVAGPDGGLLVATCETPSDLAVAGMGDVLTGAVGAFLAQGVPAFEAAGLALGITDRAAAIRGLGPALSPSDVVEAVPDALAERGPGRTSLPFPFVVFDQCSPR